MEYERDFPHCFMERTQKNLENYHGDYEATQLLNSLLGLLIVPKESLYTGIPDTPLNTLDTIKWGAVSAWVTQPIKCDLGHTHTLTLQQFVRKLRNAVAHFNIKPYPVRGSVEGFEFADRKFNAKVPVAELRQFVKQLALEITHNQGNGS